VARETLLDCFDELARAPGPYLVDDDGFRVRRHSHVEVAAAAGGFSARLAAAGVGKDAHAVIWSENRPEWVVAFWGCVRRGVVVVPVDARTSAEFVTRVARLVRARVVLVGDDVTGLSPELAIPVWRLSDLDWHAEPAPAVSIVSGDVAEIVFTSGATADPKGVVFTHANLLANIEPVAAQIAVYRRRAWPVLPLGILNLLPLSHMFGQALALFIPPLLPGVVYFMREAHPARVVALIRRHRVSVLVAVPRVLELLRTFVLQAVPEAAATPPAGEHWLRRWWRYRRVHRLFGIKFWSLVVGGAPLDPALEQFWAGRAFAVIQGYGLTETAPIVTMTHPFRIRAGSVGTALTGVEVRIASDGEILVRGDNVAGRYLGADGVRATTTVDGWFHTGDLGALDADGRLFVRGRKKDVIVAADGTNVVPDDVERAVGAVAGVREAAVVGVSTSDMPGERIHAVVVLDPGIAPDGVAREANAHLEPHQRVWRVMVWPDTAWPRTPGTGKLQRAVVRDWARRGAAAVPRPGESHGDRLAALVAAHTGHTGLSPATTLDELGLGSLDRLELQVAIEDAFQAPLDEAALAGVRDLGELRTLVDRAGAEPQSDVDAQPMPAWNRRWPARVARRLALALVLLPLTRLIVWLQVIGRDQLRSLDGPVVFASNHQTYLDAPVILAALPARLRYRVAPAMAKEFFAAHFWPAGQPRWRRMLSHLGYVLTALLFQGFPLPQRHPGTRGAIRYIAELMASGTSILLFPEAALSDSGAIDRFRPGIGLIGARLGAIIVPVRINGLDRVLHRTWRVVRPGRVTVAFGPPMRLAGRDYERLARQVEDAVRALPPGGPVAADGPTTGGPA
jgi:long-chain acyl-CoA synthetase